MKKLLGLVFLMLLLTSATGPTSPKLKKALTLEGTWELVSFYNYDANKIKDTVPTTEGYRQIKMYYNGKVMWTRYVPKDSKEWFGYGSYSTTDSTLTETLEYGSATMMGIVDTLRVFHFKLNLKQNSYSQISLDADGNRTFSENYKRLD